MENGNALDNLTEDEVNEIIRAMAKARQFVSAYRF